MIDTIVAPATIPGTGAISIVRLSGPDALSIAGKVVALRKGSLVSAAPYSIHYGSVLSGGKLLDEVLVSVFRAPHSYTGEDAVEISTHASAYIVEELVRLLLEAGARFAQPGEFTRRAFLNGKMDLTQAEAVADVIASGNAAAHRVAMNQLKGGFSGELSALRGQLLDMASLLELELDFSEEEVEFAQRDQLLALLDACKTHVDTLAASFHQGNLIKNGVPVAIVGAPNTGKSTLLNALLGEQRAIVTDIPGTTRDTVEECLTLNGILFRFIDTAGIRSAQDQVEKLGIERSLQKLSEAEIVLVVLDASAPKAVLEEQLASIAPHTAGFGAGASTGKKVFYLLNKADLNTSAPSEPEGLPASSALSISAKTGQGIPELKRALADAEKELGANSEACFVTNIRHYAALKDASAALSACRTSLTRGIPTDLVAEDLRRALSAINAILGTDLLDPETILHSIFSRHCIGK